MAHGSVPASGGQGVDHGLGINAQLPPQSLIRGMQDGGSQLAQNIEKLSSGKQINSASNHPAGLVISEQLRSLVGGLDKAIAANERTVNMVRTAEQFAGNIQDLLHQAPGLVVDTADSGLADSPMREANQARLDQVVGSISRIADTAQFGTKKLFDDSIAITPLSQDGATGETAVDSMAAGDVGTDAQFTNTSGDTVDVTQFQSLQDLAPGALRSGNSETRLLQRAEAARTEALALKSPTRSFGSAAVKYSNDQVSRYRGGNTGWLEVGKKSRWPDEVIRTLPALSELGEVSPIITTARGHYLVKLMEIEESSTLPLDQVRDRIRQNLLKKRKAQAEGGFYEELRGKFPVTVDEKRLAAVNVPEGPAANEHRKPPPFPGK